MKKENEELVGTLNISLSIEYGALFLLPQHIAQIKDENLQKKLRGIMEMELIHAEKTAQLIFSLGGAPNADLPNLIPRSSIKEILEVQLQAEKDVIKLYTLAASKCKDAEQKEMLLSLKREEEAHQRLLLRELDNLEMQKSLGETTAS